jgi:hypothetical protein
VHGGVAVNDRTAVLIVVGIFAAALCLFLLGVFG